ncbi:MAG: hypothetical protein ABSF51_13330 [Verrucomicrobiota bacterium]|jgi:hypothetical protein
MSGSQLFIRCSVLLFFVPTVYAGPGDLSMSSQVQYPTVIQGYQDPVTAQIYNEAAPGSDPVNFSVFATFPYGNSSTYSGTRAADGGSGYLTLPFAFNSGLVSPGSQTVSAPLPIQARANHSRNPTASSFWRTPTRLLASVGMSSSCRPSR